MKAGRDKEAKRYRSKNWTKGAGEKSRDIAGEIHVRKRLRKRRHEPSGWLKESSRKGVNQKARFKRGKSSMTRAGVSGDAPGWYRVSCQGG